MYSNFCARIQAENTAPLRDDSNSITNDRIFPAMTRALYLPNDIFTVCLCYIVVRIHEVVPHCVTQYTRHDLYSDSRNQNKTIDANL